MFCFMNPTGRNIASLKDWKGIKSPWIGTKNIWDLFYALDLLDEKIYNRIKSIKSSEWKEEFASKVYFDVEKHKYCIINLGKCTQIDARKLPDKVYKEYLHLLEKEFEIINPKVIILFGNQVSSIVLNEKNFSFASAKKDINSKKYRFYKDKYILGLSIWR